MDGGEQDIAGSGVLPISAGSVRSLLLVVSLVLAVVSYASNLVTQSRGIESVAILDVGDEVSIGTWFEVLLFVAAALCLFAGGRLASQMQSHWYFLSIVMFGLSIDEAASIHERFGSELRDVVNASGIFYYVWVIPALIFAAGVALYEVSWLRSLPTVTARRIIVSGVVFVAGAAFLELLAGPAAEESGTATVLVISLTALEELLEMLGLILLIHAVLDYLTGEQMTIRIEK